VVVSFALALALAVVVFVALAFALPYLAQAAEMCRSGQEESRNYCRLSLVQQDEHHGPTCCALCAMMSAVKCCPPRPCYWDSAHNAQSAWIREGHDEGGLKKSASIKEGYDEDEFNKKEVVLGGALW
jgi:hypothetical protein